MPIDVIYPKVSLEAASGRIARWLVAEGETVQAGQILFEIDNDKAAVEVDSPGAGVIRGLIDPEVEVEVGARVAFIQSGADAVSAPAVAPGPAPASPALHLPVPQRPVMPRQAGPLPTPLARRIARHEGLDLAGIIGTGPNGRIQKKDVLARLEQMVAVPEVTLSALSGQPGSGKSDALLHCVWLRRGTGVPLVLLHGFASDLNSWRGLFAGGRFDAPVLAIDLPAHGRSPRAVPADMAAVCAAVEDVLAQLVPGPMVLAGHSFGGAVATHLAARGNADIRALCLIAPAGLGPEINDAVTHGLLRAQTPASLRPWLNELVHDPAVISSDFVNAIVAQRGDAELTAAMQAFAARFFPDATQAVSIRDELARLTLPLRMIFGRDDRILPFARTRGLPGNVALHALDACGHMPQLEHRALCLRIMSEVMRSA